MAIREKAKCELFFSLNPWDAPPLGVNAFMHNPWPKKLLYVFSSNPANSATVRVGSKGTVESNFNHSRTDKQTCDSWPYNS